METAQARKTYSSKKKRRAQNGGRGDGDCSCKKKRWRLLKQEKTSRAERGAGVMETAQARKNDGDCSQARNNVARSRQSKIESVAINITQNPQVPSTR